MSAAASAQDAPQPAMVQCAICPVRVAAAEAVITERIDPDEHTWYTFHLCQGCADPADLLLDRLIREEAAGRVAS